MRRDNGSIMKRIYRVRWLLLVLMVVWWPKVSAILDAREIEALIELGAAVPQLSPKPASRPTFYSDPFNAPDDPTWDWPTTETGWLKICADGDGPNVYGLTCNNGHIVGINCEHMSTWGDPFSPLETALNQLSGLTYLKQFATHTYFAHPDWPNFNVTASLACYDLLQQVLTTPSIALERLTIAYEIVLPLPTQLRQSLKDSVSLKILEFGSFFEDQEPLDMRQLTRLERLSLRVRELQLRNFTALSEQLALTPPSTSLEVEFMGRKLETYEDLDSIPPNVRTLIASDANPSAPVTFSPTSFPPHLLSLSIIGSQRISTVTIDLAHASNLKEFSITPRNGTIVSLPPSLLSLSCASCTFSNHSFILPQSIESLRIGSELLMQLPPSLENCHNLTSLSISLMNRDFQFPSSMGNIKLVNLTVNGNLANGTAFVDFLFRTLPNRDSLQRLSMYSISDIPTFPERLDVAFPNLEYISGYMLRFVDAVDFQLDLPRLKHLQLALLTPAADVAKFLNHGLNAPQLEHLDLMAAGLGVGGSLDWDRLPPTLHTLVLRRNSLSGTLPEDFFALHPNLEKLDLSYNALTGALPFFGWNKLRDVDLDYNQFTHLPSIYGGAKHLVALRLRDNQLTSFPDDETFMEMPRLRQLAADRNPTLSGAVPTFWTTHPYIEEVFLRNTALEGPLPPQINPKGRLRSLAISGGGSVCGSLPELTDTTYLCQITFSDLQLVGTIPLSWQKYYFIHEHCLPSVLDLSHNSLSGTLHSPLLAPNSTLCHFSLAHNPLLHGPIPEMLVCPGEFFFYIFNTTLDPCSSGFPATPTTYNFGECSLPHENSTCNCTAQWKNSNCLNLCPEPILDSPAPHSFEMSTPNTECHPPPARLRAQPPPLQYIPITPESVVVSGPVTIDGDLVIPPNSSVIFSGLHTLSVTGCLYVEHLTLELDNDEVEKLAKGATEFTAITFNKGLCKPGSNAPTITLKRRESNCKAVSATPKFSGSRLLILFSVDNSRCRIWWIIVVAIVGLVLIVTIGLTMFFALRPKKTIAQMKKKEAKKALNSSPPQ